MGQLEHRRGKLIPVPIVGSMEETARKIHSELKKKLDRYYNSHLEMLHDQGYETYYITESAIFKIECEELKDEIYDMTDLGNGEFAFEVRFHNSGLSFDGALGEAFQEINYG